MMAHAETGHPMADMWVNIAAIMNSAHINLFPCPASLLAQEFKPCSNFVWKRTAKLNVSPPHDRAMFACMRVNNRFIAYNVTFICVNRWKYSLSTNFVRVNSSLPSLLCVYQFLSSSLPSIRVYTCVCVDMCARSYVWTCVRGCFNVVLSLGDFIDVKKDTFY